MRTVTIPNALIERLRALGPHFIRVAKKGKEPIDEGWPLNPMFASDPQLEEWLGVGGNYGVVGGFGLVIVDTDIEELKRIVQEKLPETFTVESPGSGGWHCYFHCSLENPIRLRDKEGENIGDIQGPHKQVVGPNSKHPNGGTYQIIKDVPLAQVTRDQLVEAFKDYVVPDKEISLIQQVAAQEKNRIDISILEVVPLEGLHRRGDEYYGPHPIHGSEKTGQNFWVNPSKNCWHCFRHGSGGGSLLWLAVEEGILDCSEAGPGVLKGDTFKKVRRKAYEKGYIDEPVHLEKESYDLSNCWTKDNKFQPVWFAKGLIEKFDFKTAESDKTIYVYNPKNGIYTETGDVVIEKEMAKYLDNYNRQPYFRDIQFNVRARTYFERPLKQNIKIACLNGLLNPITRKFESFTPEEFVTIQLPHRYIPNATCPKIQKFIKEVVDENIDFIQEFIAYCLYPGYPIHRAGMLVGDGENGKSTLIRLIVNFLGAENVSSMTLQSLSEDKFAASELYNKLANLSADLPSRTLSNTGMFKMLTGGDPISTARKYKGRIHWINRSKMLFSCNKIPETHDDTRAFFRRWHIIECKNYFPANNRDIKILDKICTPKEMSGLLNWALKGLHRLLENGKFSVAEDYAKVQKHYMRKSNSARAFIEECLELTLNPDNKIETEDLYKQFVKWCQKNGLPTKKKGILTQNINQHIPDAELIQERYGKDKKKRRRVWRYIKFVTTVTTSPSNLHNFECTELDKQDVTPVTKSQDLIDEAFSKPNKKREVADLKKW